MAEHDDAGLKKCPRNEAPQEKGRPRRPFHQISTWAPSSIRRLPGIWKNAVAGNALRAMKANSLSRHSAMPGRLASAMMFSRDRKKVVSIMSNGKPILEHLVNARGMFGSSAKPKRKARP